MTESILIYFLSKKRTVVTIPDHRISWGSTRASIDNLVLILAYKKRKEHLAKNKRKEYN